MTGREDPKENDLFFTCNLIDYIARKTKNKRADVVTALGQTSIAKIYELADVYHSDNLDHVSDDFIESAGIAEGCFDNITTARYSIPSHWDIGKVYKRLAMQVFYTLISAFTPSSSRFSSKMGLIISSRNFSTCNGARPTYLAGSIVSCSSSRPI